MRQEQSRQCGDARPHRLSRSPGREPTSGWKVIAVPVVSRPAPSAASLHADRWPASTRHSLCGEILAPEPFRYAGKCTMVKQRWASTFAIREKSAGYVRRLVTRPVLTGTGPVQYGDHVRLWVSPLTAAYGSRGSAAPLPAPSDRGNAPLTSCVRDRAW
jgi:hypothetical protein